MSDDRTDAIDDVLEHAPVEDYSGDDTTDAHGRIQQPSDDESVAADDPATDTTEPPATPSRDG
jgi:hypothetical protein